MLLKEYQREFLDFSIAAGVLRFGRFTLKSGRVSPYLFNTGLFNTGAHLAKLGHFFAKTIVDSGIEFDMLYGPAYKGIPLAGATCIALANHYNFDIPFAFNRKEIKDQDESSFVFGAELKGKILVIDDVISSGNAVRESADIVQRAGATMGGLVVALDRQERGTGSNSAIQEVAINYGVNTVSLINLESLIDYLVDKPDYNRYLQTIPAYLKRYGPAA